MIRGVGETRRLSPDAQLTPDEERTWCAFLRATRLLLDRLDGELQRDAAMPRAAFEILAALAEAPGGALRMSELAEATSSSRSRLSHAVDRLEAPGWVRRVHCTTDRRGQFAALTDAGRAALAAAAPGQAQGVRRHLFEQLTPAQVRQLRGICEAIASHLSAAPGCERDEGRAEPPMAEKACAPVPAPFCAQQDES
jgi:DNA-binding MarR family transcriptional regulator